MLSIKSSTAGLKSEGLWFSEWHPIELWEGSNRLVGYLQQGYCPELQLGSKVGSYG